jgi:hypothetical protein
MNTTNRNEAGQYENLDGPPVCQHCGHEGAWTRSPADAGYAAFAHIATNTTACPK